MFYKCTFHARATDDREKPHVSIRWTHAKNYSGSTTLRPGRTTLTHEHPRAKAVASAPRCREFLGELSQIDVGVGQ